MACACRQKNKQNLVYVRSMAVKLSIMSKADIQIYTINMPPTGQTYDCEPINTYRKTVIEYVYYKDVKK